MKKFPDHIDAGFIRAKADMSTPDKDTRDMEYLPNLREVVSVKVTEALTRLQEIKKTNMRRPEHYRTCPNEIRLKIQLNYGTLGKCSYQDLVDIDIELRDRGFILAFFFPRDKVPTSIGEIDPHILPKFLYVSIILSKDLEYYPEYGSGKTTDIIFIN